MAKPIRAAKRGFPIWLLLLGVALAVTVGFWFQRPSPNQIYQLKLTAGSEKGTRHQFAQLIADESKHRDITLALVPTRGSEEAIEQVNAGAIDLALVQGGLPMEKQTLVRQVAALSIEPMHLLVRAGLYPAVVKDLGALRGKSINISTPGSGTFILALDILAFAGLRPGADRGMGDYIIHTMNYDQLLATSEDSELPDAVFTVSSLPSTVARGLVQKHDYRLVPLPFAEALAVESQLQEMASGAESQVRKRYIAEATIPAFTYRVQPPVPEQALRTIGTRLLLIANQNVPDEAVKRLLACLFETHLASIPRPALELANLELPPETLVHPGTQQYLRDRRPLVTGELMQWLEQMVTIAGGMLGGLLFVWQTMEWFRRKAWNRRVIAHLDDVANLRRQAMACEPTKDAAAALSNLLQLRQQLDEIDENSFSDLAITVSTGEPLRQMLVNDMNETRTYMTMLILRMRDSERISV